MSVLNGFMRRRPLVLVLGLFLLILILNHLTSSTSTSSTWPLPPSNQETCPNSIGKIVNESLEAEGYKPFLAYRQPLKANCPYFGPEHGLFPTSTPHPRYIVTGGAGFIGSNLIRTLIKSGVKPSQIKVLDNMWRGQLINFQEEDDGWVIKPKRDVCVVDLKNRFDVVRYLRAADVVFHLAVMYVGDYGTEGDYDHAVYSDNALITTNVLVAAKTNGIRKIVYASGLKSGDGSSGYHRSQQFSEMAVLDSLSTDFEVSVVRLPHVFGPYCDYSRHSFHPIPSIVKAVIKKQSSYYNLGYSIKALGLIYVDQAVQSLIQAATDKQTIVVVAPKLSLRYSALAQEILFIMDEKEMKASEEVVCGAAIDGILSSTSTSKLSNELRNNLIDTIEWMKKKLSRPRIMTFLIGQPRGGDIAWNSFYHHLLHPYHSHLATYFTKTSPASLLEDQAQFSWRDDENYEGYMDSASSICNGPDKVHYWHKLCALHDIWIGGIAVCKARSSAGILQVFRWLIVQQMLALNMLNQYDIFVLTRADHFYPCMHVPFETLNPTSAYVTGDEGYGGYCDRHLIGFGVMFLQMTNTVQRLVCETDHMYNVLLPGHPGINVELTQKLSWADIGFPVNAVPRTFFAVRTKDDPAAWAMGDPHPVVSKFDGLMVKYGQEVSITDKTCKVDLESALTKMKDSPWPRIDLP